MNILSKNMESENTMKLNSRLQNRLLAAACGALVCWLGSGDGVAREKYTMPKLDEQPAAVSREVKAATSYARVVKKVAPSVVNIYSTQRLREPSFSLPFLDDPMFRRFFGDRFGPSDRQPRSRRVRSLGSGVIVSADGFILTNNHVVEGADEVEVVLADGKTRYTAKVVGNDAQTDIAVLKVNAKNLPAITITDSDKLEVGDLVLAIGNPFGVGQTVTSGIVSATGRGGFGIVDYEDFIQTDAAINPGNSGGALVDAEGRLVGINTAILSRSGGNQGVGFAVPINLARNVMERLVDDGKFTRGFLGVNIQTVTPDLADAFKLPDANGALVSAVFPNTPAAKAGIKEGDVIVEFNGRKIEDSRQLRLLVAETLPGTRAEVKLIRDGRSRTLSVQVDELPENAVAGGDPSSSAPTDRDALEGVEVTDLDTRNRQQFDIPATVQGALVTRVDEDSNAAEAGLRPGDVILEVNRKSGRDANAVITLVQQAKEERLLLRVWSRSGDQSGSRYLTVDNAPRKK